MSKKVFAALSEVSTSHIVRAKHDKMNTLNHKDIKKSWHGEVSGVYAVCRCTASGTKWMHDNKQITLLNKTLYISAYTK